MRRVINRDLNVTCFMFAGWLLTALTGWGGVTGSVQSPPRAGEQLHPWDAELQVRVRCVSPSKGSTTSYRREGAPKLSLPALDIQGYEDHLIFPKVILKLKTQNQLFGSTNRPNHSSPCKVGPGHAGDTGGGQEATLRPVQEKKEIKKGTERKVSGVAPRSADKGLPWDQQSGQQCRLGEWGKSKLGMAVGSPRVPAQPGACFHGYPGRQATWSEWGWTGSALAWDIQSSRQKGNLYHICTHVGLYCFLIISQHTNDQWMFQLITVAKYTGRPTEN